MSRSLSKPVLLGALALGLVIILWLALRERPGAADRGEQAQAGEQQREDQTRKPGPARASHKTREPTRAGGRVSSNDGQAIAGALVTLVPLDASDTTPITAHTEATGDWSIASLEPGRYALSATAEGFLAGLRPAITLRSGSDNGGLNLVLTRGGSSLTGIVHDKTGGVIEGALIQVTPQAGLSSMRERESYFASTDAEGRYRVQIPDGRHRVRATHPDYSSEQVVLELAGADQQRDFSLVPTAVIEGVVLRESDGQPVAEAEVMWSRERRSVMAGQRIVSREPGGRALTDAQGRFRIRGLTPGLIEISARASMLASETSVEIPIGIAERVEGVELWLIAAADVRGRVIAAADASPIEGASVMLTSELSSAATSTTDAEGRFVIHGVLPGSYVARASADGFRFGEPEPIVVGAATPPELELALERGAMIRGRVEPPQLAEVVEVLRPETLRMRGDGRTMSFSLPGSVTTNAETGEFELGPVEPGRYTLDARAADGRGGTIEIEVDADGVDDVVIPLEARAVLAGVVQDHHGKLVADVIVRARKQDDGSGSLSVVFNGRELTAASSPTSLEGRFEIAGLAAGTYMVEVVDAQGDPLSTGNDPLTVTLEHGRREELTLRIEPRDGRITGIVRDAEGHPVADAWVSAAFTPAPRDLAPKSANGNGSSKQMRMVIADSDSASTSSLPPTLTDAEGRFAFTNLRRGDYLLSAELDGGTSKATLEHVQPDADVILELAPLGTLNGRVLSNGKPADCIATVRGPMQRRVRVRDGQFEVERLEPGRYTVEASAGDGSTSTTVTIEAGATAEVELALERFSKITGKVLDASGKPIAGAELLIGSGDGRRVEIRREDDDPQHHTNDDGTFELHVAAGARVLLVHGRNSPMPIAIKPFVAESGKDLDLGDIVEQPPKGTLREGPEGEPE